MKIILTILYLLFTIGGLTFMKLGGNSLSLTFKNGITFKIGFITTLGFLMYILSFLLWQKLIVIFDLSFIYPITIGIVQIAVLILAIFLFNENINFMNIIGILLVIIGIIFISIKK